MVELAIAIQKHGLVIVIHLEEWVMMLFHANAGCSKHGHRVLILVTSAFLCLPFSGTTLEIASVIVPCNSCRWPSHKVCE